MVIQKMSIIDTPGLLTYLIQQARQSCSEARSGFFRSRGIICIKTAGRKTQQKDEVMSFFFRGLVVVVFCLGTSIHCEAAKVDPGLKGEQETPSFLILLADDLGYGDLSCYGHPVIKTPHLDQLAIQGMRFTDCYAAAPVCSPARAGMLSGRTPYRLGVYDWIPEGSPMHLQQDEVTFAKLLQTAGYQTAHMGKWHCNGKFNNPVQPQPDDHGFDYWFSTQNNALPHHRNPYNFVRNGKDVGEIEGYSSDIIANEAISWLKNCDHSKPFCLVVWFHSPHEIIRTAPGFVEPYLEQKPHKRAEYFGNVAQMDAAAGRLLECLNSEKLSEKTVVMFTSDNGPETLNRYGPASSRSYGRATPLRGMKLHLYEGGIRVPGIVRWPGHVRAGAVSHSPVSAVDLLPTLCDLAGVPLKVKKKLDGVSLRPVLEEKKLQRTNPLYWRYDRALS